MTERLEALARWLHTDIDNLVPTGIRPTDPIRKRALSGVYFRVLTPNEAGIEAMAKYGEQVDKLSDFMIELINYMQGLEYVKTSEGRGLILSDYDGLEYEFHHPVTDELEYYIYRVKEVK